MNPPSNTTLKVYSHNIRSLTKNIHKLRENIGTYDKYDILAFNETNCAVENFAHGIKDLMLEGFHEPLVKPPLRKSGKGGGLVTYVNRRVCDHEEIEPFDCNPDPENPSGELQFIKLHKCKGYQSTKVIVNAYRSPSKSAENFINLLEQVNRGLGRHSKKHIIFAGDINCYLLKPNEKCTV